MSMKNWKKLVSVYAQPLTQDEIQARKPKAKPPLDPVKKKERTNGDRR
jgi:hypothetical protein